MDFIDGFVHTLDFHILPIILIFNELYFIIPNYPIFRSSVRILIKYSTVFLSAFFEYRSQHRSGSRHGKGRRDELKEMPCGVVGGRSVRDEGEFGIK